MPVFDKESCVYERRNESSNPNGKIMPNYVLDQPNSMAGGFRITNSRFRTLKNTSYIGNATHWELGPAGGGAYCIFTAKYAKDIKYGSLLLCRPFRKMFQYPQLCKYAYYALCIHNVPLCKGEDTGTFFETVYIVVKSVFNLFQVFGCSKPKLKSFLNFPC